MHDNNETFWAWVKVALAWFGTIIGGITLSKLLLLATLVLTCMQGYVTWLKIKQLKKGSGYGNL